MRRAGCGRRTPPVPGCGASPRGGVVDHVDTGPHTAYSAVLGGEDGKSLFITAGPALDDIRHGTEQAAILVASELDSSHSPFLSQPAARADIIAGAC
jgi:hypothetical protein